MLCQQHQQCKQHWTKVNQYAEHQRQLWTTQTEKSEQHNGEYLT